MTEKRGKGRSGTSMDIEDLAVEASARKDNAHHAEGYHRFTFDEIERFRATLLKWYSANRRKLPWRGDPPPYPSASKTTTEKKKRGKRRNAGPMDKFVQRAKKRAKREPDLPAKTETVPPPAPPTAAVSTTTPAQPKRIDPYHVWVSEIMLQQTRVTTVIPYFLRWVERFPTIESLATATQEQVNELWAGLGYYRRAANLRKGAETVVRDMGGRMPASVDGLLKISGIGAYTAGAIGSIAFGINTPVVDGNVIRVLSRLRAVHANKANKAWIRRVWTLAGRMVDPNSPGDFNQAMMELGATVCTPKAPSCTTCPVRDTCLARAEVESGKRPLPKPRNIATANAESDARCTLCERWDDDVEGARMKRIQGVPVPTTVEAFPPAVKKKRPRQEAVAVCILTCFTKPQDQGGIEMCLLTRRPMGGLLAGQWELPSTVCAVAEKGAIKAPKPPSLERQRELIRSHLATYDVDIGPKWPTFGKRLGSCVHTFSHIRQTMHVEYARMQTPPPGLLVAMDRDIADAKTRWVPLHILACLALTSGVKKAVRLFEKWVDCLLKELDAKKEQCDATDTKK